MERRKRGHVFWHKRLHKPLNMEGELDNGEDRKAIWLGKSRKPCMHKMALSRIKPKRGFSENFNGIVRLDQQVFIPTSVFPGPGISHLCLRS